MLSRFWKRECYEHHTGRSSTANRQSNRRGSQKGQGSHDHPTRLTSRPPPPKWQEGGKEAAYEAAVSIYPERVRIGDIWIRACEDCASRPRTEFCAFSRGECHVPTGYIRVIDEKPLDPEHEFRLDVEWVQRLVAGIGPTVSGTDPHDWAVISGHYIIQRSQPRGTQNVKVSLQIPARGKDSQK